MYIHVWAACSPIACADSRIALKMCDLSAHAYRTSYVDMYIHVCAACSPVACTDSSLQHTIGPYTDRIPFLRSVQTVQIDKPFHTSPSESLTRCMQLTDRIRTDYSSYGLYRPYRSTNRFTLHHLNH